MKVIIAGGRDFVGTEDDKDWIKMTLKLIVATEVVSGTARGADRFGEAVAREMNIPVKKFPANWDFHGKSAGYIRNGDMAKYADAAIILPGGVGTAHMEKTAKKMLKTVIVREE